ncbi:hypothetical protein ASPNIDRAFT_36536 [Aspergillus niger ATCC 1015]|uniref:Uncharacterized protein n=1 Tax=Aspergillus niger (strain ATCC 1015 / CBS 113.46 / FGSC A1144 / LSHB Ac4 / NCTC 3858a / NRRL 328 / USDA 3528.7) TaxID=380704 RepID=G3XTH1_ASPNA|nr:hypothetical protein ASPNIDRAFT_36536 [Aspergillus niger ATCC 1015]
MIPWLETGTGKPKTARPPVKTCALSRRRPGELARRRNDSSKREVERLLEDQLPAETWPCRIDKVLVDAGSGDQGHLAEFPRKTLACVESDQVSRECGTWLISIRIPVGAGACVDSDQELRPVSTRSGLMWMAGAWSISARPPAMSSHLTVVLESSSQGVLPMVKLRRAPSPN